MDATKKKCLIPNKVGTQRYVKKQLFSFIHTLPTYRMQPDRWLNRITDWQPQNGKRRRGRSKNSGAAI